MIPEQLENSSPSQGQALDHGPGHPLQTSVGKKIQAGDMMISSGSVGKQGGRWNGPLMRICSFHLFSSLFKDGRDVFTLTERRPELCSPIWWPLAACGYLNLKINKI